MQKCKPAMRPPKPKPEMSKEALEKYRFAEDILRDDDLLLAYISKVESGLPGILEVWTEEQNQIQQLCMILGARIKIGKS